METSLQNKNVNKLFKKIIQAKPFHCITYTCREDGAEKNHQMYLICMWNRSMRPSQFADPACTPGGPRAPAWKCIQPGV